MSAPRRWKDPASNAPPELRALMQYAAVQVPSDAQVEALSSAVLARLPPVSNEPIQPSSASGHPGPHSWRVAWKLGSPSAGAAIGVGSLACAGALLLWLSVREPPQAAHVPKAPAPSSSAPSASALPSPARASQFEADEAKEEMAASRPTEHPPSPLRHGSRPRPRSAQRSGATEARLASGSAEATSPSDDVALLHAARSALRSSPDEALRMLREHERRFGGSALREEREALLIQLLQRAHAQEADARLRDFALRYPNSAYLPGLEAQR